MSGRPGGDALPWAHALPWAQRAAVVLAATVLLACAAAVAGRIGFPLELEWMEDGALQHARWIARGGAVYPPPSADFIPYLYTPLYPLLLATLSALFPLGFVLGRAVSVLAWVALSAAVWRAVRREGKPRSHAMVAVGLAASGYVFTYRWMDLARADTLMLALAAWGLALVRESWGRPGRAVLAGLLLALAFWTKQTAFLLILAAGVGALWVAPRQLPWLVTAVGLVAGGGVLLGNGLSDGWLWTYIYELHQTHAFNQARFTRKSWGMLVHAAPFATAVAVGLGLHLAAPWLRRPRRLDAARAEHLAARRQALRGVAFWAVAAAAAALAGALGYSTQWAEPNAFLPTVVFGAVLLGVALPVGGRSELLALTGLCAQLALSLLAEPRFQPLWDRGAVAWRESYIWQDPSRTIPSASQRERAARLRASLTNTPLPVFAPHRPWWNVLSGGAGHAGVMGLKDVRPADRRRVLSELGARLAAGRYGDVWTDGAPPGWLRPLLRGRMRLAERRTGTARVLPLTGYMSRPGMVTPYRGAQLRFEPVAPRTPPPGSRVLLDFEDGTLGGLSRSGAAFPPRPVRLFEGRMPAMGPHGGEFFLCSSPPSWRPAARGAALSAPFDVHPGDRLSLDLAASAPATALEVQVVDAMDSARVLAAMQPEGPPRIFTRQTWTARAPARVRLRLADEDTRSALCVDDVWLEPAAPSP